ncbi:MAG: hypothetical protein ACI4O7_13085 [Aristaeellaceae bacterium]
MDRSNDPAYVEESNNLATVEHHIDAVIMAQTSAAQKLQHEIDASWVCTDYESVHERKALMDMQRGHYEKADLYETYKPSPYFGRMDFDVVESGRVIREGATYLIGKAGFQSVDGKEIVVDWRNPVSTFFYQKTQRDFLHNGCKYTLLLRRAFDIRNAELQGLETEYDGEDVTLDGDVIDPFLLTVLKDKRRQTRMTDIIRTIQENQNNIIRRPYGDSFVVQGCAGSGKTMIMLHRLSFLMYNYPKLPLANIKIITPNKYFDAHISDLSHELGLANIERYSVDEYYYYLIQKYHPSDKSMPSVRSEKSLSESLLLEVYDPRYADEMARRYDAYWEDAIQRLQTAGYQELLRQFKQIQPNLSAHNVDACEQILNSLRRIDRQVTIIQQGIKDAEARLEYNRTQLQLEEGKLTQAAFELQKAQAETQAEIEAAVQSDQKKLEEVQRKIAEVVQSISVTEAIIKLYTKEKAEAQDEVYNATAFLQANGTYTGYYAARSDSPLCRMIDAAVADTAQEIDAMRIKKDQIRNQHEGFNLWNQENINYIMSILNSIQANRAAYTDYDQFIQLPEDDPLHFSIYREVEEQINMIARLREQLKGAAQYNFVLRNRVRRELNAAMTAFTEQADAALVSIEKDARLRLSAYETQRKAVSRQLVQAEEQLAEQYRIFEERLQAAGRQYIDQQRKTLYSAQNICEDNENKLPALKAQRDDLKKRERYLNSLQPIYQLALNHLREQGYIPLATLTDKPRELLSPFASHLNRQYEVCQSGKREVDRLRYSMPRLEQEINQLKAKGITDETVRCWTACKEIADTLSFEAVEENVAFAQLSEAYRRHDQKYNKHTYRHKMYLSLLFCTLYCKRPSIMDSFINIDEAQDISIAEYRMLGAILGPRCSYNLYGDVNQVVYSYKGIGGWVEDIPDIVHGNIFMLNENYRNTIPVTDYCNREFGVGMTAIGINGEEVAEQSLQDAIQWIARMKQNTPDARAAIIYRHGIRSIQDKLRSQLKPLIEFSWSEVDDKRLSVISVEMAKGLEFEYVVVVTDQMSENERYVAFTRAMEALVVVNEQFARNTDHTDDEDGNDSDDTTAGIDAQGNGNGAYTPQQMEIAKAMRFDA